MHVKFSIMHRDFGSFLLIPPPLPPPPPPHGNNSPPSPPTHPSSDLTPPQPTQTIMDMQNIGGVTGGGS